MFIDDRKICIHLPERLHDGGAVRCILGEIVNMNPSNGALVASYQFPLDARVQLLHSTLESMPRHGAIGGAISSTIERFNSFSQTRLGRRHR